MAHEIEIARVDDYREYFTGHQLQMVVASIVEGNTRARVWTGEGAPGHNTIVLWDKGNNVFYVAGALPIDDDRAAFTNLITTQIREQAIEGGAVRFKAHAVSPVLHSLLPTLFAGIQLRELEELFFTYSQAHPPSSATPTVTAVSFELIDHAFLGRSDLANMDHLRAEIDSMWPSTERFIDKGFGYAAVTPDAVIGWCTAEYLSSRACGIGIATMPAFQGHGIATATAARFVAKAMRRGVTPYWECAAINTASARVAEKVGFDLLERSCFWAGSFVD